VRVEPVSNVPLPQGEKAGTGEDVQFYATGRNFFNSRFEPVSGFQTPGASFLAGVRVRL
jgi:hypothetical protein